MSRAATTLADLFPDIPPEDLEAEAAAEIKQARARTRQRVHDAPTIRPPGRRSKLAGESLPAIIIDSAEAGGGCGWGAGWKDLPTVTSPLTTGDYSLVGFEDRIAVERKELSDLFGSCSGKRREAFAAEFERMAAMVKAGGRCCIIIESGISKMAKGPVDVDGRPRSLMNPKSVMGTLISWSQRSGCTVWTMPGRGAAEKFCLWWMEKAWMDLREG